MPENSPIGSVVGELRATDADEGKNAKIEYSIVGGADMKWFTLKSSTSLASSSPLVGGTGTSDSSLAEQSVSESSSVSLLVTRTEMDFESEKKVYNIIVRAASLPLRNDVDVEIHVTGKCTIFFLFHNLSISFDS